MPSILNITACTKCTCNLSLLCPAASAVICHASPATIDKISDIENDEDCVDLKKALHALKRQLLES